MRRSLKFLLTANALLLLGGGAWLGWRREQAMALQGQAAALRQQAIEMARLRGNNRLAAIGQVSEETLAQWRADREALIRLRAELAGLQQRADHGAEHPVAKATADFPDAGPARPAADWKDAGRSEPAAVLESALAAARGGRPEALAGLILVSSDGWHAVEEALKEVPAEVRKANFPPDRLVAAEMVRDLALDSFQILKTDSIDTHAQELLVRLSGGPGEPRDVKLRFYYRDDKWYLTVPTDATRHYVETFKAARSKAGIAGK